MIYVNEKGKTKTIHNPYKGPIFKRDSDLIKNILSEHCLMYSALRRLHLRGLIDEIYKQPLPENIIKNNKTVMKDVEILMKFCSKVSDIFNDDRIYFNWSPPTNHRDNSPEGEVRDFGYAIFRIGMYPSEPRIETIDGVEWENGYLSPIEKQLFFGQVCRITDFTPFNHLLFPDIRIFADYPIKSFEDLKKYKDELKKKITEFLLKN